MPDVFVADGEKVCKPVNQAKFLWKMSISVIDRYSVVSCTMDLFMTLPLMGSCMLASSIIENVLSFP